MSERFKIIYICFLCFVCLRLDAQADFQNKSKKSLRAFYAIAYSDIYNSTIPSTLLDKYIAASYGFGDKESIKDIILREMLFSKPSRNALSGLFDTIHINDPSLSKLPAISKDIREVPLKLFLMVLMIASIDNKNASFIEIALKSTSWSKSVSPHKPDFDPSGDPDQYIKDYAQNIQWAIKYPDETVPYTKKIMDAFNTFHNKDTSLQLVNFYSFVNDKFLKMKPFLVNDLPLPLQDYLLSSKKNSADIPTAIQIHEQPELYINEAFENLLNRKPTSAELRGFTELYKTQTDLSAESLYYVIMTSDEYNYY